MSNIETQCSQVKGLKYKMNILIPANEVKTSFSKEIRKWQNKVDVPGFRRGKAPEDYVRKNYSKQIHLDATESLIESAFSLGLTQNKLSPAGPPKIDFEPIKEDKDFKCELVFEVHPKVEVTKYENIKVKVQKESVEEKHIDQVIKDLKKTHPLKKEDAKTQDAKVQDVKKEDSKKTDSSKDVSEDDLWAQSLNEKDLKSLRTNIQEHLKVKFDQSYQDQVREQILDQLITSNPMEIPEVVIESQRKHIISSAKRNLQYQGKNPTEIEEFLKKNEADTQKQSRKHAHVSYLIYALSKKLNLAVAIDQVHKALKDAGHKDPLDESLVQSVQWQMIQSRVLDYLADKAEIKS